MLVAGLLISSAVVRLSDDAGRALARTEVGMTESMAVADARADADPASCTPAPDVAALLVAFRTREDRIERQEAQIADRMQALAVADATIEKKLAALTTAEEELRATIALADAAAEDDLSRLTAVYESMKPKEAAALFEQMDPEFAAGFLGRMDPAAAAGVMAGLQPATAYTVSVILAGRNANVPRN
jgi:flagellar motility protein MotE (MotC chaperone)